jgi:hypothetical protein
MQKEYTPCDMLSWTQSLALTKADVQSKLRKVVSRRSFLKSVCTVCAMLLLFLTRTGQAQMLSMRSSPPDLTPYVRPQTSEEAAVSRLGSEYLPGAERE